MTPRRIVHAPEYSNVNKQLNVRAEIPVLGISGASVMLRNIRDATADNRCIRRKVWMWSIPVPSFINDLQSRRS